MAPGLPVILGAALIGSPADTSVKITTFDLAQEYIDVFRKHGGKNIDTSRHYPTSAPGTSEALLGQTDVSSWAIIDTKVLSNKGCHAPEEIEKSIRQSLEALKVQSVNMLYLHFPDRSQELSTVVAAMAEALKKGSMKKWAISNYSIEEVKTILEICEEKACPKPVVYQGHYNALTRRMEEELLPLLRQHGIAFYAYSPGAGGAFAVNGSRKQREDWLGNFSRSNYHSSPALTAAIEKVQSTAATHQLSGHEVALRWVQHHSALRSELGDAMIIGASSTAQLETTMEVCARGALPEEVVRAVEGVWGSAREGAPDYSPFVGEFSVG